MNPTLREEKKLWKNCYKNVACIDEAGVGPLAGPVVAAAVIINPKHEARNSKQYLNFKYSKREFRNFNFGYLDLFGHWDLGFGIFHGLRDSKKLSAKQRDFFYNLIIKNKNIKWGVGIVSEKIIDKINIYQATKLAMARAVAKLKTKNEKREIDFLIVDGKIKLNLEIPQKSIVKGDEKVFSCAMASIIAKVTRDRIMENYDRQYPNYQFKKHKGYGTKLHFELLRKYGPCSIHRKSFAPIRKIDG